MKPGTPEILRALIWLDRGPNYARVYLRLRRRGGADPSLFFKAIYDVSTLLVMMVCCGLTPGAYLLLMWISRYDTTLIAWAMTLIALLLIGGGFTWITYRISRAVIYEQIRDRWSTLLTTPDERYRVVLYTLAYAYRPYLSMIGLVMLLLAGLLATPLPNERTVFVLALLIVEWLQLQAFSITAGLWGSLGRSRTVGTVAPLLLIVGWLTLRAALGMLLIFPDGPRLRRAALLIGPMARIIAPSGWIEGIGVTLLYFCVLEVVIRLAFARSMKQAGEL